MEAAFEKVPLPDSCIAANEAEQPRRSFDAKCLHAGVVVRTHGAGSEKKPGRFASPRFGKPPPSHLTLKPSAVRAHQVKLEVARSSITPFSRPPS
jgi:hypothetical protein